MLAPRPQYGAPVMHNVAPPVHYTTAYQPPDFGAPVSTIPRKAVMVPNYHQMQPAAPQGDLKGEAAREEFRQRAIPLFDMLQKGKDQNAAAGVPQGDAWKKRYRLNSCMEETDTSRVRSMSTLHREDKGRGSVYDVWADDDEDEEDPTTLQNRFPNASNPPPVVTGVKGERKIVSAWDQPQFARAALASPTRQPPISEAVPFVIPQPGQNATFVSRTQQVVNVMRLARITEHPQQPSVARCQSPTLRARSPEIQPQKAAVYSSRQVQMQPQLPIYTPNKQLVKQQPQVAELPIYTPNKQLVKQQPQVAELPIYTPNKQLVKQQPQVAEAQVYTPKNRVSQAPCGGYSMNVPVASKSAVGFPTSPGSKPTLVSARSAPVSFMSTSPQVVVTSPTNGAYPKRSTFAQKYLAGAPQQASSAALPVRRQL
eukprot:TRINITY_DN4990_c0_g1_i2.p1 TRINITY_DN4990_c0_g1~~TRINITY_DN4990_c0_g1_i2.p1  ORF type:complete len:426 (-),score=73.44 TRINITY_DN4990_c0_g1_i2:62-1339(-)